MLINFHELDDLSKKLENFHLYYSFEIYKLIFIIV